MAEMHKLKKYNVKVKLIRIKHSDLINLSYKKLNENCSKNLEDKCSSKTEVIKEKPNSLNTDIKQTRKSVRIELKRQKFVENVVHAEIKKVNESNTNVVQIKKLKEYNVKVKLSRLKHSDLINLSHKKLNENCSNLFTNIKKQKNKIVKKQNILKSVNRGKNTPIKRQMQKNKRTIESPTNLPSRILRKRIQSELNVSEKKKINENFDVILKTNPVKQLTKTEIIQTPRNILTENKNLTQNKFSKLSLGSSKKRTQRNLSELKLDDDTKFLSKPRKFSVLNSVNIQDSSNKIESTKSTKLLNLPARSNTKKSADVFEFRLSQTSSIEGELPTDDVISKLAQAGKIEMVKYKKGTGRLQTRFRERKKALKKTKKNITSNDKYNNPLLVNKNKLPNYDNNGELINLGYDKIDHCQDNADNAFANIDNGTSQNENIQSPHLKTPIFNISTNYSPLAKTIMNKQNTISNKMQSRKRITDKKELFDFVKKHVQDNNRSRDFTSLNSPWRVSDEYVLPKTFYMSRDSQNLPSYSSDHIPATPIKPKYQRPTRKQSENILKSISPFGNSDLNDSNAENIPINNTKNVLEINPLKGIANRTPLKIIEVLHLPQLAFNHISTPKYTSTVPGIDKPIEENEQNISIIAPLPNLRPATKMSNTEQYFDSPSRIISGNLSIIENQKNLTSSSGDLEHLFGFEEELLQDENLENFHVLKTNKSHLKTKLKNLKRLLPKSEVKPTRFDIKNLLKNNIFDDSMKKTQKNLKQMFSSTMIEGKEQQINESTDNFTLLEPENEDTEYAYNASINLFGDSTEINDSNYDNTKLRTYLRPKKRIRHNFITCMDSDDEEETEKSPKKKQKINKKDQIDKAELTKFYDDFNKVLTDVDQFELIIEKE